MMIKKKFVMDAPNPKESGLTVVKPINHRNNDANTSGILNRESSGSKIAIKTTHMGPSALKTRQPLGQWPQQPSENQQSQSRFSGNATPQKMSRARDLPSYQ